MNVSVRISICVVHIGVEDNCGAFSALNQTMAASVVGYSLTVANANEHAGKKACPYAQSGATALTGLN